MDAFEVVGADWAGLAILVNDDDLTCLLGRRTQILANLINVLLPRGICVARSIPATI